MAQIRYAVEESVLRAALALPSALQRALLRRPVVLDDQTLSAETQLMLKLDELAGVPVVEDLPFAEARVELVRQAQLVGGRQPIGALRDVEVDGAAGRLPARLYAPSTRLGADPVPTLMFFHGGGMVYGDLESHDAVCRFLAESAGVQVLAVDYRLAPEHPFPAAVDDCFAAFRWLVEHADSVNADPQRLAVGGDSAGGYLSATTAIQAAEAGLPLAAQLLVYPCTDFLTASASRKLFGEGFYLTSKFIDQATDAYFADEADRSDELGSIALRNSVPANTAPAHVVTAGFDPLRDEGEAYVELLRRHGVPVTHTRYSSMIHGFFNIVGVGREARGHNREIAARLAQLLG